MNVFEVVNTRNKQQNFYPRQDFTCFCVHSNEFYAYGHVSVVNKHFVSMHDKLLMKHEIIQN